jgi:IclR family pca regulon transcriptional regulator
MSEFVQSFDRGLSVIRSFNEARRSQTLSEVARATGLSRASARRLVLTMEQLGYVREEGGRYALTPRVLELGYAFLSSLGMPDLALPYLERLAETVQESTSVAVLDDTDIVYVARVPANRVLTISVGLGTRFPAVQTSLGRVMIAHRTDEEIEDLWNRSGRPMTTENTVANLSELKSRLAEVREQGWALNDQELETGVRSLAAPIRNGAGKVVAGVNVTAHASRNSVEGLVSEFLPELLTTADDIGRALSAHPGGRS